jgi:hypothetical protein
MKYISALLVVVAVGLAVVPRLHLDQYWTHPDNRPTELFGLDLVVPQTIKDKDTAQRMAGLCDGIADVLENDGKSGQPKVQYAITILDLRRHAAQLCGTKLGPDFGQAVEPIFDKEIPDGSAQLDPVLRAKAVALFRALAYSCSLAK